MGCKEVESQNMSEPDFHPSSLGQFGFAQFPRSHLELKNVVGELAKRENQEMITGLRDNLSWHDDLCSGVHESPCQWSI
jgi:hypothetical protein